MINRQHAIPPDALRQPPHIRPPIWARQRRLRQENGATDGVYVRRHGRRIRLREELGSKLFLSSYAAALEQLEGPSGASKSGKLVAAQRGSLRWLGTLYFGSEEFKALDLASQRTPRRLAHRLRARSSRWPRRCSAPAPSTSGLSVASA